MSQKAAMRLRRRFKIKFRDVAKRGRSIFPKTVTAEQSSARLRSVIEKQQLMRQRKK